MKNIQIAIKLLELQKDLDKQSRLLSKAGFEPSFGILSSFDLMFLALDVLGVPRESKTFCRDCFADMWCRGCAIDTFILEVTSSKNKLQ